MLLPRRSALMPGMFGSFSHVLSSIPGNIIIVLSNILDNITISVSNMFDNILWKCLLEKFSCCCNRALVPHQIRANSVSGRWQQNSVS